MTVRFLLASGSEADPKPRRDAPPVLLTQHRIGSAVVVESSGMRTRVSRF